MSAITLHAGASVLAALLSGLAMADAPSDIRFLVSGGFTAGGDRLTTAFFTNGTQSAIKAGERLQLNLGAHWQPANSPFSAQLTYGYHADSAEGDNGKITFDRWPLELLAHYHWREQFFLGGGVRMATRSKLTYSINGLKQNYPLDSEPGLVGEIGWQPVPTLSFVLRGVSERYKSEDGVRFDGGHVGLFGQLVF